MLPVLKVKIVGGKNRRLDLDNRTKIMTYRSINRDFKNSKLSWRSGNLERGSQANCFFGACLIAVLYQLVQSSLKDRWAFSS